MNMENLKYRLFVDIDGTLARFFAVDSIETLYEKGYFRKLPPITNVVNAVRDIIYKSNDIEVFILSAYLTDSKYAKNEKNQWLDEHLPEIDHNNRVFVPCGTNKSTYIENISEKDFLLDDYTKNLKLWSPPGKGIKLLNGINHTRGSWKGDCVSTKDNTYKEISDKIISIITGNEIKDIRPNVLNSEQEYKTLLRNYQQHSKKSIPKSKIIEMPNIEF